MSVADNMAFSLKMSGVDKQARMERVKEASLLLGLEDYLDRKPKALSGGQRQRVAMGRAIVRHPQVFCMDEPLSNLDAKLRVTTRSQIASLQQLQRHRTGHERLGDHEPRWSDPGAALQARRSQPHCRCPSRAGAAPP